MKFKVTTSGVFYSFEDCEKLRQLGFSFVKLKGQERVLTYMKSGPNEGVDVEIGSLEELISFCDNWGGKIVLSRDSIEIYDDFKE